MIIHVFKCHYHEFSLPSNVLFGQILEVAIAQIQNHRTNIPKSVNRKAKKLMSDWLASIMPV